MSIAFTFFWVWVVAEESSPPFVGTVNTVAVKLLLRSLVLMVMVLSRVGWEIIMSCLRNHLQLIMHENRGLVCVGEVRVPACSFGFLAHCSRKNECPQLEMSQANWHSDSSGDL